MSTDLSRLVTLPAAGREPIVRRQLSIWRTSTGWSSLGGPDPETGVWSLTIDRKAIRRYRDVATVEDFLRAAPSGSWAVGHVKSELIDVRPGTAPPTNPHETDTDRFVETPSRGLGAPLSSTVPALGRRDWSRRGCRG